MNFMNHYTLHEFLACLHKSAFDGNDKPCGKKTTIVKNERVDVMHALRLDTLGV